jgi:hypothetical protein
MDGGGLNGTTGACIGAAIGKPLCRVATSARVTTGRNRRRRNMTTPLPQSAWLAGEGCLAAAPRRQEMMTR